MVKKDLRFHSWDGFIQIILKQGSSVRADNLSLKTIQDSHSYIQSRYKKLIHSRPKLNTGMALSPKFAVVVSKKVSKSAVKRNRIRRRIFEWIRLNESNLQTSQLTMVFANSELVGRLKYPDLDAQLKQLFEKADLHKL